MDGRPVPQTVEKEAEARREEEEVCRRSVCGAGAAGMGDPGAAGGTLEGRSRHPLFFLGE